jgi:hypothetical protein
LFSTDPYQELRNIYKSAPSISRLSIAMVLDQLSMLSWQLSN